MIRTLVVLCGLAVLPGSAATAGLSFEKAGSGFHVQRAGYRLMLDENGQTIWMGRPGEARRIRTTLAGANVRPTLRAGDPSAAKANYLLGNDASRWRTQQETYQQVRYESAYPGIDLVFYGSEGRLEYDFVVKPGADPRQIALLVDGADRIEVDRSGDLVLRAGKFETRWAKPVLYQEKAGVRQPVDGRFVLSGNRVRFAVGRYDRQRELVIDPVLNYATYVGGRVNEASRGVVTDAQGNVYIAGYTTSDNLPSTGGRVQAAYGGNSGGTNNDTGDAFVARFSSAGALQWITYLGGRADDIGMDIALDAQGNIFVTGFTTSTNFPVSAGALQGTYRGGSVTDFHQGGDGFVTKLNNSGSAIVYSTYLGGRLDDRGLAITVDAQGNALVAGNTVSTDFPVTAGVVQGTYGGGAPGPNGIVEGGDTFVAKLNATGTALTWSTYLGGSLSDSAADIAIDATGAVYVTGGTLSTNFPTTAGAFQRTFGGVAGQDFQQIFPLGDVFVTKMNPTATALVYSTYLGGSRDETAMGMVLDRDNNVYLTGMTSSTNFPTTANAPYRTYGGPGAAQGYFVYGDAFVSKLNAAGSALVYSTLLGGGNDDGGWGIVLDKDNNAWIGGTTNSSNLPLTTDALQKTFGGNGGQTLATGDAFIAKLNAAGSAFAYVSYFGGSRDDGAGGITMDSAGNIWVTGSTMSTNFAVAPGASQAAFAGGTGGTGLVRGDAFLARFSDAPPAPTVNLSRVANAASYDAAGVAPGEWVVLLGENIGPTTLTLAQLDSATGRVATTLAETRVLFDGIAAPLVYVFDKQVVAAVPYSVSGRANTQVVVEYRGTRSAPQSVRVLTAHPGLFTANSQGFGPGAIYNQDSTLNTADNAAAVGSIIILFGTGEGSTIPAGVDGQLATTEFPKPLAPLTVTIGGQTVPAEDILYVGIIPGQMAGVFQINVRVPQVAAGPQDVRVKFGDADASPTRVTVAVK